MAFIGKNNYGGDKKIYHFEMDSLTYVYVDSIWKADLQVTDYELSIPIGDKLRQQKTSIINFFAAQKFKQDSIISKPKK